MRTEFAGRGITHIYWFVYLTDRPVYGHVDNFTVVTFYDSIISCSSDAQAENIKYLDISFRDMQEPVKLETPIGANSLSCPTNGKHCYFRTDWIFAQKWKSLKKIEESREEFSDISKIRV